MKSDFIRLVYSSLAVFAFFATGFSQTPSPSPTPTPPATDIFLIDLRTTPGGHTKMGQPVKITTWPGYNNQPSFFPDRKSILYTSIREKQADIYRYDIREAATNQVNKQPGSEYSTTLLT